LFLALQFLPITPHFLPFGVLAENDALIGPSPNTDQEDILMAAIKLKVSTTGKPTHQL
jgi:hypothetical protein